MALSSPSDQVHQVEARKRRHELQSRRIARLQRRMAWAVRRARAADAIFLRKRPVWARISAGIAIAAVQMAALTMLFVWGVR